MSDLLKLKEELVLACKRAYRRGIQTGSGGNVSARVPDENLMIVKASGSSFEDSTADGFVITDFDGNLVEGDGKPTREALLHGYIYRICPHVGAVVHVHSPYAIGWASTRKALPRVTWHAKLKMCADIPTLDIPSPMVRIEDFPMVKEIFDESPELPAFLLADHGVVAVAKDPISAEHTAELVEETAQVAYLELIAKKFGL
ncbi:class II aldolase/adducin family protein [Hydrogenoanaerobacterium sp.]|uniref:class II aldolase/adducin family protein n=1 Tax=Hydrogenoanaerobacterium sp. TaxID=2953763 RepID=UPI002897823B|nr:class II aldolase/adducin family protein [Hydrogenoanaerobacterium sp.]